MKCKIMIIEDDFLLAEQMQALLCRQYEVRCVKRFDHVVADVQAYEPHLVLLDINLPGHDGFYWCEKLRILSNVPILFISARSTMQDTLRAIRLGGDDYVVKPFCPEIAPLFLPYIDQEVYFHDVDRLQDELEQERCRNSELKDGIDRIVYELKASLATLSLCQGQADQDTTRLVIETMNRQLGFLLLQSRLETSVMDVQFQKSDLRSLIGTAIKNNKYLLIRSRFESRIDCPPLFVYTDPEWLIYVLDQLLMNAIKYRRDPLIEIRAFQDENETVIEFKDHGIGIESQDLLQVFEKGFTGGNTRSGTYRSTGMGLYFVRTVMDRLSGSVEVQSAAGSYTLFTLRLFNDARRTWLRKKMDHTDL